MCPGAMTLSTSNLLHVINSESEKSFEPTRGNSGQRHVSSTSLGIGFENSTYLTLEAEALNAGHPRKGKEAITVYSACMNNFATKHAQRQETRANINF